MDTSSSSTIPENQSVTPVPSVQAPLPQITPSQPISEFPKQNYWKFAVIVLGILVVGLGGGLVYVLQKQSAPQPEVTTITPTSIPSPTSASQIDETATWKTYTDENLGISFKYPSGYEPQEVNGGLRIEPFLYIEKYADRRESEFYKQNAELVELGQNDLQPVTIEGKTFSLIKFNWADGGGPSNGVPNCSPGTAQPDYFVDIPSKLSLSIHYQVSTICDAIKGKVIEKGVNGKAVENFDEKLETTYEIISTITFIN